MRANGGGGANGGARNGEWLRSLGERGLTGGVGSLTEPFPSSRKICAPFCGARGDACSELQRSEGAAVLQTESLTESRPACESTEEAPAWRFTYDVRKCSRLLRSVAACAWADARRESIMMPLNCGGSGKAVRGRSGGGSTTGGCTVTAAARGQHVGTVGREAGRCRSHLAYISPISLTSRPISLTSRHPSPAAYLLHVGTIVLPDLLLRLRGRPFLRNAGDLFPLLADGELSVDLSKWGGQHDCNGCDGCDGCSSDLSSPLRTVVLGGRGAVGTGW